MQDGATLEAHERRNAALEQTLRDAEERARRTVEEPRCTTRLAEVPLVQA